MHTDPVTAQPVNAPVFHPRATQVLIGLNVAVFAVMVLAFGVSPTSPSSAELLRFGANNGLSVVLQNEWWRALTAMFLHVGVLHLGVNMYSLLQVGGFVEHLLGRRIFVLVYLVTGLASSFSTILWNPLIVSAGASGAIFGLFGVIVGFTIRARKQLAPGVVKSLRTSIISTLGFNLVFGVMNPFIDNAAHLGGLVFGTLAGFMATSYSLDGPERRRPGIASQAIVIAATIGMAVLAATRTKNNPIVRSTEVLLQAEQVARADAPDAAEVKRLTTQALAIRDDPRARNLRAWAELHLDDPDAGLADLEASVAGIDRDERLQGLLPETLTTRAQLYTYLGKFEQAEADFTRSLGLLDAPQTHAIRAMARLRSGRYVDAVADFREALKRLPDDATLKNNYAWALVQLPQGDLDLALDLANQAVKNSQSAAALGTRCFVYAKRNQNDLALADCRLAVEKRDTLQPGTDAGLIDRGMLAFLEGDFDAAISTWEAASAQGQQEAREVAPWLERARSGAR